TIFEIAGNLRLKRIGEQLFLPIYFLRFHSLLDPISVEVSAAEHERIAKAILAGQAENAEKAMRRHVRTSGDAILEQLSDEDFAED
ncbi:MAG: FCD domain-containing protein, partial [Pseudomonadota bacterium]